MELDVILVVTSLIMLSALLFWQVGFEIPRRERARMRQIMEALSTAIQLRFPSHEGLSTRLVSVCRHLAFELELSPRQIDLIEASALLQDIGLCAVPYAMINKKPMMMWTETENATYARYPEVSAAMLELVPSLSHIAPIIRESLADYNDELSLEARVLRVAHDFVWTESRLGGAIATERLALGAGTQYDPDIVGAFLGAIEPSPLPPAIPVRI
ncbi:MAG: HD domain-containing phosphohydrolase [Fimbriimonadaceae bacterium]